MAILKHLFTDLTSTMSVASLALLIYFLVTHYARLKRLPPGPWGFPIVGVLFSIKKEFHLFLLDHVRTFGKVLSFKMGSETIVVISDHKLIKKAFMSKDFTARPKTELTDLLGGYGETLHNIKKKSEYIFVFPSCRSHQC